VTPSQTAEQTLMQILQHPEFVSEILRALDAAGARGSDARRRKLLDEMASRVAQDIRKHPRRDLLYQFLLDESKLSDGQVTETFDFIYSHLVSQFKGELAELMAWPILLDFRKYLESEGFAPRKTVIVPAHEIQERQAGHPDRGWYKGADGLLVGPGDVVVAVVEIKSYRPQPRDISRQFASHLRRLSFGFKLRGRYVHPAKRSARVARLLIRPSIQNRRIRRPRGKPPRLFVGELVPTTRDLMEAGFRFADWFLRKAGEELFGPKGHPRWPDTPPAEAAQHAIVASMYYVGMRTLFADSAQDLSVKERRARRTLRWLYNSLCYGYQQAREWRGGSHIQFPEEHPKAPRAATNPDARASSSSQEGKARRRRATSSPGRPSTSS
jgi:hypothetical protein